MHQPTQQKTTADLRGENFRYWYRGPKGSSPDVCQKLPDTLAQAHKWEFVKTRYLSAGLCHKCAALAAWGHQDHAGWSGDPGHP